MDYRDTNQTAMAPRSLTAQNVDRCFKLQMMLRNIKNTTMRWNVSNLGWYADIGGKETALRAPHAISVMLAIRMARVPQLKTAEFQTAKTARIVSGSRKVNAVISTPGLECKSPGPSSAGRRPTDPPQPKVIARLAERPGLEEAAREAGRRLPGLREAIRRLPGLKEAGRRLPGLKVAVRGLPGLKEAARR